MPQIARPFHTLYAQHTPILLIYSRPPTHRQALPQCPTLLRTNVQILTQKPHIHPKLLKDFHEGYSLLLMSITRLVNSKVWPEGLT